MWTRLSPSYGERMWSLARARRCQKSASSSRSRSRPITVGVRGTAAKRWSRRHGSGDGEGAQSLAETECSAEEDGGRPGSGHGDFEGSREGKLVSPERRRRTIAEMRRRLGPQKVSERRACRVLNQPRSTQRYQPCRPNHEPRLLREMRALARQRPRFGAARIHRLLVERDWQVNLKRVHRLWKRENLQVPRKQHRRRRFSGSSENSCVRCRAQHKDHV